MAKKEKEIEKIRVEVGFIGGRAFVGQIEKSAFEKLMNAVTKGEGWHELNLEDGQVTLNLSVVTYVKSDREEINIGF